MTGAFFLVFLFLFLFNITSIYFGDSFYAFWKCNCLVCTPLGANLYIEVCVYIIRPNGTAQTSEWDSLSLSLSPSLVS